MGKTKILEVTSENEKQYLRKIAQLEEIVLENMTKQGKIGQLFITGAEDISEYINSKENTVMIAVDEEDKVKAATYITQGQKLFTYNDITKYFKTSPEYQEYVKSLYPDEMIYKQEAINAYEIKMKAYTYARQRILEEFPQYQSIEQFLQYELSSENGFDEKSVLREKINAYMSEFIENQEESGKTGSLQQYERFFWMTSSDLANIIYGKEVRAEDIKNMDSKEYEKVMLLQREHEDVINKGKLQIHEEPEFDQKKYFTANPNNSIEIDTYLTDPNSRSTGLARKLVFEAVKKHIDRHFENPDHKEIFLCSTLHRENVSSKYVSEFFGLEDSLFVKRRQGRDREVHITRIEKEEADQYKRNIQEKLAVLYGYKSEKIKIPIARQKEILEEQLQYEKREYKRLNRARHYPCKYKGNRKDMETKANKIIKLKKRIKDLQELVFGDER